jgi:hypothetical protein
MLQGGLTKNALRIASLVSKGSGKSRVTILILNQGIRVSAGPKGYSGIQHKLRRKPGTMISLLDGLGDAGR